MKSAFYLWYTNFRVEEVGKRMGEEIKFSKEQKEDMASLIREYFEKEKGEEIGHLASMLLLDFFTKELGPIFYNQGIEDSYAYMTTKMQDLFEIQK